MIGLILAMVMVCNSLFTVRLLCDQLHCGSSTNDLSWCAYRLSQDIHQTLRARFCHYTVFTIAHHLSTVMDCDRIAVGVALVMLLCVVEWWPSGCVCRIGESLWKFCIVLMHMHT